MQRRRAARLRRRRPARHLSRHGRASSRRHASASPIATRSIATLADGSSRTCRTGGRGRRGVGQRRVRRRFRRRRAPRSLRHELGAERPVPQPRRRHVRGHRRARRRRRRRLEHRLHVLRRRRRRRPRPVRRALRRDDAGIGRARAQRTLVWRNGPRIMVGPAGLPGEADLFFENVGSGRFAEATEAHGLADRGARVRLRRRRHRLRRRRRSSISSWPTTRTRIFCIATSANGRFESVGLAGRRRGERRGSRAGGHGRRRRRLRRRRPHRPGPHRIRARRNTLYRNVDGRQFEDASVAGRLAAPTFDRMGWGTAFLDADLDGKLDLFFANGHIFADIDDYPQLGETYRRRTSSCSIVGSRFRDVSAARRRRPAGRACRPRPGCGRSRRRRRPRRRGEQHGRRADAAREPPADRTSLGGRSRRVAPTGNRFAIGAKVTVDAGRQEAGARDPLGRQLSVAERSARALRPRRLRRSRRRGGPHARRAALAVARRCPATACTSSSSDADTRRRGWCAR